MIDTPGSREVRLFASVLALAVATPAVAQAQAQDDAPAVARPEVNRAPALSSNATVNLINLLVKQGVLSGEQATALIKQAEEEAYIARQAARDAAAKAQSADVKAEAASRAATPPGTKRVTYVPEIVKNQLRDEIKTEVMAKAEKENWASPGAYPEWAQRIRFSGDLRMRGEGQYYPKGNGPLRDFNATNSSNTPFQEEFPGGSANPYLPPRLNTSENRERYRLRARLGADIAITDAFSSGIRLATGENNSPVSLNQSLGAGGGNFSKYPVWIDRAFIKYQPIQDASAIVGRFDNPFFSPTDLVWANDLGFDGAALNGRYEVSPGFTPFAAVGVFPLYSTPLNASLNTQTSSATSALRSANRWMAGAQLGAKAEIQPSTTFTGAVGVYDFTNVQGRLSAECFVYTAADVCDTDLRRPSFAQKGNTYMWLRDVVSYTGTSSSTANYQFYGLASSFRPVVASAQLDLAQLDPIHVFLDGEYVNNVAFRRANVAALAVPDTNRKATASGDLAGEYDGGNKGWLGRLTVGNKDVKRFGDWKAWVGYKYLESDAVMDAFTDSDFGLGGTNLKGYFIGGSVGLGNNVWATARWLSANAIAGQPYAVDVLQLDLSARF